MEGFKSLKWNNHMSTFFHVLSNVRKKKDNYADATLACDGQFYPVHKLVLSSCSDYFEEMFAQAGQANCKHPFIVLKDIKSDELECLLSYMYIGEVNVVQEKLSGLIKAAECLRIKGLAVPDEEPPKNSKSIREKRLVDNSVSPKSKRRKKEDNSHSTPIKRDTNSRSEERKKQSADSNQFRNSSSNSNSFREESESNVHLSTSVMSSIEGQDVIPEKLTAEVDPPAEMLLDESNDIIKSEPEDIDDVEQKDERDMAGFEESSTDNQHHFMDQLLANSSAVMGDYTREGSTSLSAGGSQLHPVMAHKVFQEIVLPLIMNSDSATVIRWLQGKRLLKTEMECKNCGVPMNWTKQSRSIDGFIWRCQKKDCITFKSTVTIRNGSFFSRSKISLKKWIHVMYLWCEGIEVEAATRQLDLSRPTMVDMYNLLREICFYHFFLK